MLPFQETIPQGYFVSWMVVLMGHGVIDKRREYYCLYSWARQDIVSHSEIELPPSSRSPWIIITICSICTNIVAPFRRIHPITDVSPDAPTTSWPPFVIRVFPYLSPHSHSNHLGTRQPIRSDRTSSVHNDAIEVVGGHSTRTRWHD